uniref:Uncharacterized protein n=1 Tax=Anguilla anguilla TaxID=7936 RepID=A0A0E9WSL6_ANGAN
MKCKLGDIWHKAICQYQDKANIPGPG